MIRINLLPYRAARKKENVRNQILIFVAAVVGFIAILSFYHIHLGGKIKALNTQIEGVRKEVVKYNKIVEKVEKIREKMALVQEKLNIINVLDLNRKDGFYLLKTMSDMVIENRMWFTYFESLEKITVTKKTITVTVKKEDGTEKKKKKKITEEKVDVNIEIKGIALDNKTAADFMTRLENAKSLGGTKMFDNVKLVTLHRKELSQGKGKPGINLKGFEISCVKVPLEAPGKNKAQKKAPKK